MSRPPLAFRVSGLDCAEEVMLLKRAVGPLAGGEERLGFDLLAGRMTVPAGTDPEAVIAAVAAAGLAAEPWRERAADHRAPERRLRTLLTTVSGLATGAGFLLHLFLGGGFAAAFGHGEGLPPWPARLAYLLAIAAGGWFVAPRAWAALRARRPDMHLLMTLAVAGALALGDWFEAATVTFLFALSLALEAWSVGRARRAVTSLLELAPPTVRRRLADGTEEEIPAAEAPIGLRFVVRPGERIPLDGEVAAGESEVDQAPITGESLPVLKSPGAEVFAGTINGRGALEIVATRTGGDTTLARILRSVEEARSRRSPAEQWVERFARVYTPAVFAAALTVAAASPLLFGLAWGDALYRALVLLVIACPCALVISTPVAVVAALAAAAHRGVLIKGGAHLEAPARLRAIAFDKTGTLTAGHPEVVEIVPLSGHDERELLERAAALEADSEHPLARAIRAAAAERGVSPAAVERFESHPGKGATGLFGGQRFWIGSHRYLEERGQETPEVHDRLEAIAAAGQTAVVVGNDVHVCGFLALADTLRPEAREALAGLRAAGVRQLVMLTGDHAATATAVAAEVGLDAVRAELLPDEKLAAIEALVRSHGTVAMVGDGVNDAPAMARATLGIAMGSAGTDAAIETADIALMADDLGMLPWLVRLSRRALGVIRQNIVFALGVKAAFVLLTLLGTASLWAAIAADTGASLLVVANALRLLRS
ncbi:MAG TPA: heavy metal translocating P-type ATPase [Thermoanaerobaculia bacterium]|nr:heavy metal translocating P-type ATPase [Thermoanaerobaculia bacterium]HRS35288.1 heavy metal translocating P-type ATPase [Thermoanaerobaculia bacterium]HRU08954.1 heavy metal translocating P-type ATPase [Thermoanaerobaculia bacterium]